MRSSELRRSARSLVPALLLAAVAIPCRAIDFAEVELLGSSISQAGAPANFGFPSDSPDLVSSNDSETPIGVHGDHEDAEFVRDRLYRDAERVNAGHSFGPAGPARGTILAGHSISVTTGYADAGSNQLGGSAEANAGSLGPSDGSGSCSMSIEKTITILPGTSGLESGALVSGLRWALDGEGSLEVGGRSFPNHSAASAAVSLGLLILRGPTGTCGIFDCPHGALAVAPNLSTGLAFMAADPALPDGTTAQVTRHDSWNASNNAGDLKAGGVFESGSETVEVGFPVTDEDVAVVRVEGVHTDGPPLGLDAIEFEANVGETLTVQMDLDVYAVVAGLGNGESDFFGSFDGHVEDPQGRGLVFESSVPVPEPALDLSGGLALAMLSFWRVVAAGLRRA